MKSKGGDLYVYIHGRDDAKLHDWSYDGYQSNKNGLLHKKNPGARFIKGPTTGI